MQEVNVNVNCHLCYNELPVHYNRFQLKLITRPLVGILLDQVTYCPKSFFFFISRG